MTLAKLPGDILFLVFHLATIHLSGYWQWKDKLPLLAVCTSWRQILAPLVYADIFVSSSISQSAKNYLRTSEQIATPDSLFWSNIQLIQSIGYTSLAKSVHIHVSHKDINARHVYNILKQLEANTSHFQNVTFLDIYMNVFSYTSNISNRNKVMEDKEIIDFVECFKAYFPNVNSFSLVGDWLCREHLKHYGAIASCYSNQLKSLVSKYSLFMIAGNLSPSLTKLELNLHWAESEHIPLFNAETLQYLKLTNIPLSYNWISLCKYSYNKSTTFNSLEVMKLYYKNKNDDFGNNAEQQAADLTEYNSGIIAFPRLRKMHLEHIPPNCAITTRAVLPDSMSEIRLDGSATAIAQITQQNKINADSLYVVFKSNTYTNTNVICNIANRIISAATVHGHFGMEFEDVDIPVSPSLLASGSLTSISLAAEININELCLLIEKYPELVYLNIGFLDIGEIPSYIPMNVFENHSETQLAPFNTRIKELHLMYDDETYYPGDFTYVMGYFALRIPTLEMVDTDCISKKHVLQFVGAYKEWYPHLSNIRIN